MRILMTGKGSSGSWQIRGEQLGRAIGATVLPNALDVGGYDLAVLVKRPVPELLQRLRRMDVPIIWDVVDAWPQPHGNAWDRETAITWLRESLRHIQPKAVVAATMQMAIDCNDLGVDVLALPHHARAYSVPNPVRERVQVVGYDGSPAHLGRWVGFLRAECARRGWRFVIDQISPLQSFDIVVALREHHGYAPRHWKSNVKLANAQASGTPFIGNREDGYLETASGAEYWADSEREVIEALNMLESCDRRRRASAQMRSAAPSLEDVAKAYREWLHSRS